MWRAISAEENHGHELPNSEIHSSWFVGVGSRKCPLDGDLSELAKEVCWVCLCLLG